ncbi:MAG: MurR/RpiR family transcriptional regulator [Sinomonas sp.]|nr:MurR/RpiR family transcriptional regulator [Sinomonas sp.]
MSATDQNIVTLEGPTVRGIRAALPSLVPSERRVAELILAGPKRLMYQSISEVAAEAGSAASTVVRACRSLGFKGFQDLRLALAQDVSTPITRLNQGIDDTSTPGEVLETVFHDGAEALKEAASTIDRGDFARSVDAISDAGKVLFVAVGTSAPLAQDAAYRFLTIGVEAEAPPDVHVQHVRARLLGPGDACIAISHTGATQETLAVMRGAAAAGAQTIAISSFARSPLTDVVDITLVAGSAELSYRIEAMASRIAHLGILDALFLAVALRRPDRAGAAQAITAEVLSEHRF